MLTRATAPPCPPVAPPLVENVDHLASKNDTPTCFFLGQLKKQRNYMLLAFVDIKNIVEETKYPKRKCLKFVRFRMLFRGNCKAEQCPNAPCLSSSPLDFSNLCSSLLPASEQWLVAATPPNKRSQINSWAVWTTVAKWAVKLQMHCSLSSNIQKKRTKDWPFT